MRYLIVCLLFLSSCMTVNKAKKVLDAHPQDAAEYCAFKYPVREHTDSSVKEPDPRIVKQAIDSAVRVQDSICNDYANAMNLLLQEQQRLITEGRNTGTIESVNLKVKVDSLKRDYQARVKKEAQKMAESLPAKEITVIKTVENTAKVEYYRIESERQAKIVTDTKESLSKWKKIALFSIGFNLLLVIIIFRKPILGLLGKVLSVGVIPPI